MLPAECGRPHPAMHGITIEHFATQLLTARTEYDRDVTLHMALWWAMSSSDFSRLEVAQTLFRLYYVDGWEPAATFFFFATGHLLDKETLEDDDYTVELCLRDEGDVVLSTRTVMSDCRKSHSPLNTLFFVDEDEDGDLSSESESDDSDSDSEYTSSEEEETDDDDEEEEEEAAAPWGPSPEQLEAMRQDVDAFAQMMRLSRSTAPPRASRP